MTEQPESLSKMELVAAVRMLEQAEYMNHSGHCSVRRDEDSFYVNSGASIRASLSVDDVLAVDLDGRSVDSRTEKPPLEFPIHAEIYRSRPDVNAVIHTHPQWSTYLTSAGVTSEVVYGQAAVLGNVRLFDSPESINTQERGRMMVAELGDNSVILLKSHGAVCAGPNMLQCFAFAAYVEENARRQYMAMQIGKPYVFSAEETADYRVRLHTTSLFKKAWDYYASKVSW